MAKVLIVDDDRSVAKAIGSELSGHGHECVIETQGARALDTARGNHPDIVLLDIMMPDMSGFEVCRRIRRDPELFTVPILMVSAMNGEAEVMHGIAQGADDYMTKPLDRQTLVHRVDRLLGAASGSNGIDTLTELPDKEGTRRNIQRCLSENQEFAAVCMELLNLRPFARKGGGEARGKAIRHVGRIVSQCVDAIQDSPAFTGHMGGGYFMCLVPSRHAETLCNRVREAWLSHRAKLYESCGLLRDLERGAGDGSAAILDVLCCATFKRGVDEVSLGELFETISRLRHKALESEAGGVFVDMRSR